MKSIRKSPKITIEGVKWTSAQRARLQMIARTKELSVDDVAAVAIAAYVTRRKTT
jgi:hypothetical protein